MKSHKGIGLRVPQPFVVGVLYLHFFLERETCKIKNRNPSIEVAPAVFLLIHSFQLRSAF